MINESAMSDLCDHVKTKQGVEKMSERGLPLATTEFGQALLPNAAKADFDFEALCQVLTLGRLQLSSVARQELRENLSEIPR